MEAPKTTYETRSARAAREAAEQDVLVVELPDQLPVLTPGLARALARLIVAAGRSAGLIEVADTDELEAIASRAS